MDLFLGMASLKIASKFLPQRFFSVSTTELVKVGEELTVHYMMDMENAPDWYLDAWDK